MVIAGLYPIFAWGKFRECRSKIATSSWPGETRQNLKNAITRGSRLGVPGLKTKRNVRLRQGDGAPNTLNYGRKFPTGTTRLIATLLEQGQKRRSGSAMLVTLMVTSVDRRPSKRESGPSKRLSLGDRRQLLASYVARPDAASCLITVIRRASFADGCATIAIKRSG